VTTFESVFSTKVKSQSHEYFVRFFLGDTAVTRRHYLALSKAWPFNCYYDCS